jgi:SAM-dependent methyltransferase
MPTSCGTGSRDNGKEAKGLGFRKDVIRFFRGIGKDRYVRKEDYVYDTTMIWFERHLNAVLLREKADVLRGTVLDLGCNHGLAALHLARRGERVIGVDLNRAALRRAVSQAGDFFPGRARNVLFLNAMMQALPLRSDSFDAVLLFDVLEHIYPDDYDRVFPEIFRVVKPGGALFLVTPQGRHYDDHAHVAYFFTSGEVASIVSRYGFLVEEIVLDERPDEHGSPHHRFNCLARKGSAA